MTVYYHNAEFAKFRPQLMHFKATELKSVIESYSDEAIADYVYELGLVKEALDEYNLYVYRDSIPKTQIKKAIKNRNADKFKWFKPAMKSELQQLQFDVKALSDYEQTVKNVDKTSLRFDVTYQQYLDGNTSDELAFGLLLVQAFIDRGYPKASTED